LNEEPGRVLAVDLGEQRIGLALSDPLRITAQPLETLRCVGPRKDLQAIVDRARQHDVARIVVGLPLLLSGEEGAKAADAREVAERLRRRLRDVPVELWDERLTTVQAERAMIEGNVRRRARRKRVDTVAAALILQSYLDARSTGGGSN
jgi:putative Holliday junction resolvase